jgi:BirA family biotin operon repressor/biotin-[acetyl-CoA-carboxylase] ligase
MSSRHHALIALLADGRFHSGEQLGRVLGVSRAAVWKMMARLETLGLQVHAVSGKGYRLAQAFEPLERETILAAIGPDSRPLLRELTIVHEIESTNRFLLQQAASVIPSGTVCLAEYQSAGRGRRGRQWQSPYGSSMALSLLWRFQEGTSRLAGLSLAVAVALMRMLEEQGLTGAGIKWPNDILFEGHKLAGILLDVAGESNGPCYVVIGVGVNCRLSAQQAAMIDQPWTDLWQAGIHVGRNHLTGRLLHHLLLALNLYQHEGLDAFRQSWQKWDLTRDKAVAIHHGDEVRHGIARGIDENGLLRVEHREGVRNYASGEVSLRAATS